MPRPRSCIPALRLLAVLLALAGCTAPAARTPVAAVAAPLPQGGPAGGGTIVAMRPLASDSPARRSVLAALGVAPGAAADGAVEFVVRGDDGRPISVMQGDVGDLRAGDRVALIPGHRTRIAPVRVLRAAP